MSALISVMVDAWSSTKDRIEAVVPIDNVLLHIAVGMMIYWIVARIIKGPRATLGAWLLVLVAALANEFVDLMVERWPNLREQLWQGTADIFWTLALPSVALFITRPQKPLVYAKTNAAQRSA